MTEITGHIWFRHLHLWNDRSKFQTLNVPKESSDTPSSVTRETSAGMRCARLKEFYGRGGTWEKCVDALHMDPRSEFDPLRTLGVKFEISTLQSLGHDMLCNSTCSGHSANLVDPRSQQDLHSKAWSSLDTVLYGTFLDCQYSTYRKNCCSAAKEKEI